MFDTTRFFDVIISLVLLILLFPFLLVIGLLVKLSSKGPVLFKQKRVGKNNIDFALYKFRTMYVRSNLQGGLTIGDRDKRITTIGYFLRKYKLDELPQLYNVLINDMSIVGPRPELRQYVNCYSVIEKEVLLIKPGITDYASVMFRNESELLAVQPDPEQYYTSKLLPVKIRLSKKYIKNKSLNNYFVIIFKTLFTIFK